LVSSILCVSSGIRVFKPESDESLKNLERTSEFDSLYGYFLTQGDFNANEQRSHLLQPLRQGLNAQKPVLYYIGDSTVRNLYVAMCGILNNGKLEWVTMYRNAGAHRVFEGHVTSCGNENVTAVWLDTWKSWPTFSDGLVSMKAEGYPEPTGIVVNSAMHLMQLMPARPFPPGGFEHCRNYASELEQALIQITKISPQANIAVMNAHSVCHSKLTGLYKSVSDLSEKDPAEAARPCVKHFEHVEGIETAELERICTDCLLTRSGVMALNKQLKGVVEKLKLNKVRVMDSFGVTDGKCDHTQVGDGRHFNSLILDETRLLLDTLGLIH